MQNFKTSKFNKVYNLKKYDAFILFNYNMSTWIVIDETGKEIYECIDEKKNLREICFYLQGKYNVEANVLESDVDSFLQNLLRNGFILIEDQEEKENDPSKEDISQYPFNTMMVAVTSVCNLDCIYCFNKKDREGNISEQQCDGQQLVKAMRVFKENGGMGVLFTGGEPFISKQLCALAKEAKSLGLNVGIITNGTLINSCKDLEQILDYTDEITISLDSIDQEELTTLWNKEPNMQEIFAGLSRINEYSKTKKLMKITISPIITKINRSNLLEIYNKLNELLCNCLVKLRFTKYQAISDEEINKLLAISDEEYEEVYLDVCNKIGVDQLKARYAAITQSNKYEPYPVACNYRCKPSMFIDSKGDVYPCQGLNGPKYQLGNIKETEFEEIKDNFLRCMDSCCYVKYSQCVACEFKYMCSFKGGICGKNIPENCKEKLLEAMYLNIVARG